MKRKFLFTFGCVGFFVAIVLLGPLYRFVLQSNEPTKVVVVVYSVAVLINVVIYALIGSLVWSVARRIYFPNPAPRI